MVNVAHNRTVLYRFVKVLTKKPLEMAAGHRYLTGTTLLSSPAQL
jgi:hypothetical protein